MDKFDILLWAIGAGFTVQFTLLLIIWNALNNRMDKSDERMVKLDAKLSDRIEKLDAKLSDRIDKLSLTVTELGTRTAVIESKLTDLNTNVGYLMWHHQTGLSKDMHIKEE